VIQLNSSTADTPSEKENPALASKGGDEKHLL
jgi:hypothetical protein